MFIRSVVAVICVLGCSLQNAAGLPKRERMLRTTASTDMKTTTVVLDDSSTTPDSPTPPVPPALLADKDLPGPTGPDSPDSPDSPVPPGPADKGKTGPTPPVPPKTPGTPPNPPCDKAKDKTKLKTVTIRPPTRKLEHHSEERVLCLDPLQESELDNATSSNSTGNGTDLSSSDKHLWSAASNFFSAKFALSFFVVLLL